MSTPLPANASFEHLKKQAKDLLRAHDAKDAAACATLRNLHRFKTSSDAEILAAEVGLHDTQFAVAIEYGFRNWTDLKARIEAGKPGNGFVLGDKPEHPELDYLRQQARNILDAHAKKDAGVCSVLRRLDRFKAADDAEILGGALTPDDARLALALEYGFKSWVDLKGHASEWRNRQVDVPGPFRTAESVMALPDGAAQMILRLIDNGYVSVLLQQETPPVPEWIKAHIPAGRREYLLGWKPTEGAGPTLEESRQSLLDMANDLHSRFHAFGLPGGRVGGTLSRLLAMDRKEIMAWGRAAFLKAAGPKPASRRTTAELVSLLKGIYDIAQFPIVIEAITSEFADEPLLQAGLKAVAEEARWWPTNEVLDAKRKEEMARLGERHAAILASDCGFTKRAELKDRIDDAGGDTGPFRTVDDVLGLADGGLQLVAGFFRSWGAGLTLVEFALEPGRRRFVAALPEWKKRGTQELNEWESTGTVMEEATRELVRTANALHSERVLARPGEPATAPIAPLTLKTHPDLAAWARKEFVRIAGTKRSSRRDVAELGLLFEGLAAISLFQLAAETVVTEFVDEELVRMAATQFVDTRPSGGVRDALEVKAKALSARHQRRLDLVFEGSAALLHGEPDNMIVARCEAFL